MKKPFLKSFTAFICLLLLCGCFSNHKVSNKNILKTDTFLEKPEQLVAIVNGKEKEINDEAINTIYEPFTNLIANIKYVDTLKTQFDSSKINEQKKNNTCFEFRYLQRRCYTNSLDSSSNYFTWGNIEFDAFLFINNSTNIIAVPYLENKYVGINNLYLLLEFEESNLNNFIKIVENEY